MPTGGELLVDALRAQGVEVVFGIPGTHNLEIYRHLGTVDGPCRIATPRPDMPRPDMPRQAVPRHVTPRHEQGAGYAADGYARITGRPGVVVTTSGPGLLNAAAAAGQAYSDSVPLLLLSSGPPLHHERGSGLLHEVKDQSAAMAAICADSRRVHTLAEIPRVMAAVFAGFAGGRPRPVHVEVPYDLLGRSADVPAAAPVPTSRPCCPPGIAEAAARELAGAERPVIIAGGGARNAAGELRRAAESLGAPVVTTANGKGVLPESHPLSLGAALHVPEVGDLLRSADAVLAVGTELAETDAWNGLPGLPGLMVRVDVDPDQVHRPVPAAYPLVGDAADTLARMLPVLADRADRPGHRGAKGLNGRGGRGGHSPSRAATRAAVAAYGRRWRPVVRALRAALPQEAVLVNDNARACYFGALTGFAVERPGRFLHPTGFGTLGYALPAAIGASLGAPERPVAVLTGDGGFQFTASELATAVELGLSLPVVVVANGGYGMIAQEMEERGIAKVGVALHGPDLPALGRAYGGEGVRVTGPAELRAAVARALTVPHPTVIEIPEPPAEDPPEFP